MISPKLNEPDLDFAEPVPTSNSVGNWLDRKVSVYESCANSSEAIETIDYRTYVERVKNGYWRGDQKKVRSGNKNKKYVNAIAQSGVFPVRENADLKGHSGVIGFDVDNEDPKEVKKKTADDKFVSAVADSISGKGCVIFALCEPDKHSEYFEQIKYYLAKSYGFKKIDDLKDITRLRICSYDPDIIVNENAELFPLSDEFKAGDPDDHLEEEEEDFENLKRDPETDEDFKNTVNQLVKKKIDVTAGYQNWNKLCFAFVNQFGEEGRPFFHEISQFNPDYDFDECDKHYSDCLRSDNRKGSQARKITIATFYDVTKKYFPEKNQLLQYCGVYSNNFKAGNVELSTGRLRNEAVEMGYYRYGGSYIKNTSGVLKKVEKENVYADLIKLCAVSKVTFEVKSKSGTKLKFSVDKDQLITIAQKTLKGNLSQLAIPEFTGEIARDTTKEVLLHFTNKSIKISASSIDEIDKSNYCVWEDHIVKRELLDEDIIYDSVFETFVRNISGENFEAFCTAIGYLLVNCNGSEGLKALWLYDANFEAGKLKGRTGKSLLIKAIGVLRKLDLNSGKEFDHVDRFKFQGMDRDTQIVVLDDVKENLNFTALFNFCTEGAEYQKKFADKVKLSIHETPKLCITSNYPPPLEQGASVIGRIIVLPVLPYYSSYAVSGGVKHVHGQTFFDDWDPDEWNRFFWFMIDCTKTYLQKGLIHVNSDASLKSRLKAICAQKLKDEDRAEHLVEWLYDQPQDIFKRFNLYDIKQKWAGNGFNSDSYEVDDQHFSNCLKVFFDIKGWQVKKTIERIDGSQKRYWNVTM